MIKDFINIIDYSPEQIRSLLQLAQIAKQVEKKADINKWLAEKILLILFAKNSTRTRISFDVAMQKTGGHTICMNQADSQMGRDEAISDTANVVARMVDFVMLRMVDHQQLVEFATHCDIPVINGLTNRSHPCQVIADALTYIEARGELAGKKIVWIGDCNNVFFSWLELAIRLDLSLTCACPAKYQRLPADLEGLVNTTSNLRWIEDPQAAASDADLIMTDVWDSMGDEEQKEERNVDFSSYQVNSQLMSRANSNCVFMHCLPARRGQEVSVEVLEGSQSLIFPQAENRIYAQMAILKMLADTQKT